MKSLWVIGLAIGLSGLALGQITFAYANPNSLTQLYPALEGIQLTSTQQDRLKALNSQTLPQIQDLLTAQQLDRFNAFISEGKGLAKSLASLNLSIPQKMKLRNISTSTRSQLTTILTTGQQEQLSQNIQFQLQTNH